MLQDFISPKDDLTQTVKMNETAYYRGLSDTDDKIVLHILQRRMKRKNLS